MLRICEIAEPDRQILLLSMEKLEKFGSQTPKGRAGPTTELGSIYVQLAAGDASFATGQIYGSAGGSGQP